MTMRSQPNRGYENCPSSNNLPIAFGAQFQDDPLCRANNRRSHTLGMDSKLEPTYSPHTKYQYTGKTVDGGTQANFSSYEKSSSIYGGGNGLNNTGGSTMGSTTGGAAADHPILRFLAYTKELVPESADEAVRVRRIGLSLYTLDNSIAIREGKQPNSGMVQGQILLRQQVPRDPTKSVTDILTVDDFNVGSSVSIYKTVYHIVDMDESTRTYFRQVLHKEVPDFALPWPQEDDVYNSTVQRRLTTKAAKAVPTNVMEQKRVAEQLATGLISKHDPDQVRTAQQFQRTLINQALQFAAYWDDRNSISGDLRLCVVKYFLENDTIEVIERRGDNCGREGGPKLLCRQRVPKDGIEVPVHAAPQNTFGVILKNNYLEAVDIVLGKYLTLSGRNYYVYDADTFTREYMRSTYSVELGPAIDVSDVVKRGHVALPLQHPPPHNGFGTEEDSYRNWVSLTLKPPRIDAAKLEKYDGKTLVYEASLAPPVSRDDAGRHFTIVYHMATDELEIHERQVRNSGIIGGKFLAKHRHLKQLPDGRQVPYAPSDFVLGMSVTICGRTFLLNEIDAASQRILDGIEPDPQEDHVRKLILHFKGLCQTRFLRLHEAYRRLAPDGSLTFQQIAAFFRSTSWNVTDAEAKLVAQYMSPTGNGVVVYEDFIKALDVPYGASLNETCLKPSSVKNVNMSVAPAYNTASNVAAAEGHRRRLKQMLVDKVQQRRGTVQEVFRLLCTHAADAKLRREPFLAQLRDQLQMDLSKEDQDILCSIVFGDKEALNVQQFYAVVE